ncbi:MAG TPA: twin-arginine translocation signal domain-containing protein [Dehalococcoidales bacterium]|nr:twin-arginine translocation signal domain-containing protein [Dehalococcoidales bacterium]
MTGSYDTPERERSSAGLSRRKFLKYAGGIAGIGVLGITSGFGLSGMVKDPKPADVSGRLQKLTFGRLLGEAFGFRKDAFDVVDLELVEAADAGSTNIDPTAECFSLLFKGPRASPLQQGTYLVQNEAIGEFHLFIVPVYPDRDALKYEAVFNRV